METLIIVIIIIGFIGYIISQFNRGNSRVKEKIHYDTNYLGSYEFNATLWPYTPLKALKHHGEIVRNTTEDKLPKYSDSRNGIWLPFIDKYSESSSKEGNRRLEFLVKFRQAYESDLPYPEKEKIILNLFEEYNDLSEQIFRAKNWYLWELMEISGISESIAENLFSNGIISREDVNRTSDSELLKINGIGSKRLKQIRSDLTDKKDEEAQLEGYRTQVKSTNNEISNIKKKKEILSTNNENVNNKYGLNYIPQIIERRGIQILESLHILSNTKNIDTLKGRFEFIENLYDDFVNASSHKRFVSDIQNSIDEYKMTYYERIPNEYEINLLIKPDKENLKKFYIDCIFNCFKKFQEEQEKQIESIKRQDSKERRIKKILNVANEAKSEMMDKSSDKQMIDNYIYEIEQIINVYKGYLES